MKREVDRLTSRTYDVLVVGGGIYGLTIAYDAVQRGLAVALIERDDFGSGASFNHLRTIHGGLRYLQTLDLARARESLGERRTLARIAPHLVRPLSFVLPLHRSLLGGKSAMRLAFALDRLVAFDRNRDVPTSHRLAGGCVLSRDEAVGRFPDLDRRRLTGAAVWQDHVTIEADRLTFSFAAAAASLGAVLANHVEAVAALTEGRRVVGARGRDRQTGRGLEISARVTVNATGAAIDRLVTPLGAGPPTPMLKAMNLVTRRRAGDTAIGGRAASGRLLFMVPWRGRALFGTWESPRACDPGDTSVAEADLAAFIDELNQGFPTLNLTMDDVTLVHRGIVPAIVHPDGRVTLARRERIRDDVEGIVSVAGAKYTTARATAERVVDGLFRKLQRAAVPCRTSDTPLPGGETRDGPPAIARGRDAAAALPGDGLPHLMAAYGSRYRDVLDLASDAAEWRAPVADDSPVIGAALVWAVRKEMAITLRDAVVRRTPLGALGYPGDAAVDRAAAIVGSESGWSSERTRAEIADLRQFYAL